MLVILPCDVRNLQHYGLASVDNTYFYFEKQTYVAQFIVFNA